MSSIKRTVAKWLCYAVDKSKPVLLNILPRGVLRFLKNHFVYRVVIPQGKERIPYQPGAYPKGVNLIGHMKAEMGLGQGSRLTAKALEASGLPMRIINFETGNSARHGDTEWESQLVKKPEYNVNIIHINAGQIDLLHLMMPQDTWDKRYNIAIWLWELEDFPDAWCKYFSLVDEVWAPSRFTAEAIAKKSPVPVRMIPYGIYANTDSEFDRSYFGLPSDRFLFLCMYDVNSTMARKNPLGAIHAFKQAFDQEHEGVGLVLKLNNANEKDREILREELEGYKNIYLIDRILSKAQVNSLIKECNVLVSLHRSEGFGLVLAEAMYLGVPVIGTNWSSTTDFMTADNSCPVDYTLVKLDQNYYMFKENQRWAQPDIKHAASYMQRLFNDPEYYRSIAEKGRADITEKFSIRKASALLVQRLKELDLV